MDVNTFDVSVNSAVLSGADNRECAEYENVVAFIIIIITPANDESFFLFFFGMKKKVLNLNLDSIAETKCAELAFAIVVCLPCAVPPPTAISVFTNVTIHNRDEKGENCQLVFLNTK